MCRWDQPSGSRHEQDSVSSIPRRCDCRSKTAHIILFSSKYLMPWEGQINWNGKYVWTTVAQSPFWWLAEVSTLPSASSQSKKEPCTNPHSVVIIVNLSKQRFKQGKNSIVCRYNVVVFNKFDPERTAELGAVLAVNEPRVCKSWTIRVMFQCRFGQVQWLWLKLAKKADTSRLEQVSGQRAKMPPALRNSMNSRKVFPFELEPAGGLFQSVRQKILNETWWRHNYACNIDLSWELRPASMHLYLIQ